MSKADWRSVPTTRLVLKLQCQPPAHAYTHSRSVAHGNRDTCHFDLTRTHTHIHAHSNARGGHTRRLVRARILLFICNDLFLIQRLLYSRIEIRMSLRGLLPISTGLDDNSLQSVYLSRTSFYLSSDVVARNCLRPPTGRPLNNFLQKCFFSPYRSVFAASRSKISFGRQGEIMRHKQQGGVTYDPIFFQVEFPSSAY